MLIAVVIAFSAATYTPMVYVHRDQPSGTASLRANGDLLSLAVTKPSLFQLRAVCRYDVTAKKWVRQKRVTDAPVAISGTKRNNYGPNTDQVLLRLPPKVGLYWLEWSEDGHIVNGTAFVGPVLCQDIDLGNAPEDMIATCVPSENRKGAQAMFVPDPTIHCRE